MIATDELLRKFGGSTSLLRVTIETYLSTWSGEFAAFGKALAERDESAVLKRAHTIKGFLGYLADDATVQLAGAVEKAAKEKDLDTVGQLAPQLHERLHQLTGHLTAVLRSLPG